MALDSQGQSYGQAALTIAWGSCTGMRKGKTARLMWDMLDGSGATWVPRIPAAITKNRTGRTLGLEVYCERS